MMSLWSFPWADNPPQVFLAKYLEEKGKAGTKSKDHTYRCTDLNECNMAMADR
jgi:hypothetical protein